jgi:hypothetical protein
MSEQLYYVVSVHHTKRDDPYLLLWNPDDKGYCHRIEIAGRYPQSHIAAHLDYYHNGDRSIAVKCEVIDAMAVQSAPGYLDTPGFVAPNSKGMWFDILYAPTWPTTIEPAPQYKGARRRKEPKA